MDGGEEREENEKVFLRGSVVIRVRVYFSRIKNDRLLHRVVNLFQLVISKEKRNKFRNNKTHYSISIVVPRLGFLFGGARERKKRKKSPGVIIHRGLSLLRRWLLVFSYFGARA